MLAQGKTLGEIARAHGVSIPTVRAWARRNGVTIPQRGMSREDCLRRGEQLSRARVAAPARSDKPRLCECCGKVDISDRPATARYCLQCRNSGLVLFVPGKARNLVNTMVRAGLLPKPTDLVCVDCGRPAQCYDHRDYFKPMDVEPVCDDCNAARGSGKNRFPWRESRSERLKQAA